jgi:hypothetical protein
MMQSYLFTSLVHSSPTPKQNLHATGACCPLLHEKCLSGTGIAFLGWNIDLVQKRRARSIRFTDLYKLVALTLFSSTRLLDEQINRTEESLLL